MTVGLSHEKKHEISQAIKAAEANTSGEIYCVVARKSDDYSVFAVVFAVFWAIIIPLLLAVFDIDLGRMVSSLLGGWQSAQIDNVNSTNIYWILGLQLAIFIITALVAKANFYTAIVPKFFKHQSVHKRAMEQFLAHGIQQTADRTGVLIYISLKEHIVEIIADSGIHDKVGSDFWDKSVNIILEKIKQDDLAGGLKDGITEVGNALSKHFPQKENDENELSDSVIFI